MSQGDSRPARVVRLKHTVRFELVQDADMEVKARFGWDFVVQRILRDFGGMGPAKIFCLQDFAATGFMDVTLAAYSDCTAFFEKCCKERGNEVFRGIRCVPLFAMDEVPVTVHLYNPYVEDTIVQAFLGRYCSSVSPAEKVRGRFGIWNGKRRFLVRLRVDPARPGGLLHPPGSFAIGPHRGFLHYPGQPLYCRRCGAQGHSKESCPGGRCRFCGSAEHSAAECGAPKTCSLCGSQGHLFRACPSRQNTFASLFEDEIQVFDQEYGQEKRKNEEDIPESRANTEKDIADISTKEDGDPGPSTAFKERSLPPPLLSVEEGVQREGRGREQGLQQQGFGMEADQGIMGQVGAESPGPMLDQSQYALTAPCSNSDWADIMEEAEHNLEITRQSWIGEALPDNQEDPLLKRFLATDCEKGQTSKDNQNQEEERIAKRTRVEENLELECLDSIDGFLTGTKQPKMDEQQDFDQNRPPSLHREGGAKGMKEDKILSLDKGGEKTPGGQGKGRGRGK